MGYISDIVQFKSDVITAFSGTFPVKTEAKSADNLSETASNVTSEDPTAFEDNNSDSEGEYLSDVDVDDYLRTEEEVAILRPIYNQFYNKIGQSNKK